MDPFFGLGSTAVACADLRVKFLGVEIDRTYLDEAIARVKETLAQRPRRTGRTARA